MQPYAQMAHIQPLSAISSSSTPSITPAHFRPVSYDSPTLLTPRATPSNFIHSRSQNLGHFVFPYQIPVLSTPIVTSRYEQLRSQRRRAPSSQQTPEVIYRTSTHTTPASLLPWGLPQQHLGTNPLLPANSAHSSTSADGNTVLPPR
jgi:hypothetical protein